MPLLSRRCWALAAVFVSSSFALGDEAARLNNHVIPLPPGARFRFASLHLRQPASIRNSALSPDGKLLAAASGRSVMVWDLKSGFPMHRFQTPEHNGYSSPGISFSADGTLLGFVHGSESAFVWNIKTGKEILRLAGKVETLRSCGQFSADGGHYIVADRKGIHFWNLSTGNSDRFFPTQKVNMLSPDATTYVQIDEKAETIVGDAATGKKVRTLAAAVANNGIENGLAFTPDGKWLALVNINKDIQILDTATWNLHASIPLPADSFRKDRKDGSRYPHYRLRLSHDARLLFLGTGEGTLRRWDVSTKKELPTLTIHHGDVANIHDAPDGSTLITTGADGLIRRWNLKTGASLAEPEGYATPTHAALSPDGRRVVAGDVRGRLDLWDATTGKLLRTLQKTGPAVEKLAFDATSEVFALAQEDGTIVMWNVSGNPTGKTLTLPKSKDERQQRVWMQAMRFSSNARSLYAASWYRAIRFDLATGMPEPRGRSGDFALSADGAMLAIAHSDKLTIRDETTGKVRVAVQIRGEHEGFGYPIPMAYSPDGRWLAIGVRDGHIILFDAATGEERKRFVAVSLRKDRLAFLDREGHHVTALSFSPDGRWLISCGTDLQLRLWETATAKQLLQFEGHDSAANEVAFSRDSRTAFTAAGDGQSFLWELRPGTVRQTPEQQWNALASDNASLAFRTVWALSDDHRGAVFMLRSKVVPVASPDMNRIRKLIADLDGAVFRVRDAAHQELSKYGDVAAHALKDALKKSPVLETQRRVEKLLSQLERDPSPAEVREIRAIQSLELAGTPEAQALLHHWAGGAPGARLTENARSALGRVERRAKAQAMR